MIACTGVTEQAEIIIGVDTHRDCHVAVVISVLGVVLETGAFAASAAGYQELLDWARVIGRVERAGVEGTGSYGAGLTRALRAAGVEVVEVNRPNRAVRRRRGKSDAVDAESAARAVLSGEATVVPKNGDGPVEAVRVIKIAKDSAVTARVQAVKQLRSVLVNAGARVREPLEELPLPQLIVLCAAEVWSGLGLAESAVVHTLGRLAGRIQFLEAEIKDALKQMTSLIQQTAPDLLQMQGIGPDSAAALLIATGDNPERLRGEASFAALCGTSPVEASSGKTSRRRLSEPSTRSSRAACPLPTTSCNP